MCQHICCRLPHPASKLQNGRPSWSFIPTSGLKDFWNSIHPKSNLSSTGFPTETASLLSQANVLGIVLKSSNVLAHIRHQDILLILPVALVQSFPTPHPSPTSTASTILTLGPLCISPPQPFPLCSQHSSQMYSSEMEVTLNQSYARGLGSSTTSSALLPSSVTSHQALATLLKHTPTPLSCLISPRNRPNPLT
jgi:hypothetical protein